jgi:hypothetical protein
MKIQGELVGLIKACEFFLLWLQHAVFVLTQKATSRVAVNYSWGVHTPPLPQPPVGWH